MRYRRTTASGVATAAVVLMVGACSGAPAASSAPSAAASATPAAFDGRLSCEDSTTDNDPQGPAPTAASGAVSGPVPEVTVESAGFRSQDHGAWLFWKRPVGVPIGTTATTVEVLGDDQRVVMVPASLWTTGAKSIDVDRWATNSVTLQPCADRRALFLGGVIVESPRTCLDLRVTGGAAPETVRQRLDGTPC